MGRRYRTIRTNLERELRLVLITVLYSVLCCTIQYCTVQCSTILYRCEQYCMHSTKGCLSTVLCSTVLYTVHDVQYSTVKNTMYSTAVYSTQCTCKYCFHSCV